MHEVGTAVPVRALHVMPDADGPEAQLHAHDYRIDVVVERHALGPEGMVADLDVLDAALGAIADRVRGEDLGEHVRPPAEGPVTVEVFARWVHEALAEAVRRAGGDSLLVRVWESPSAFGGYRAPV